MKNNPLVSLCLFFYNQEDFVDDAINGAISQTYGNCEIILSDDCSTDATYDKIKSFTKDYHGSKKIIINRNPINLGLVSHVNKILFELSNGDIVCLQGGDDVSLPNRLQDTVNYFIRYPNLSALTMSYHVIDKYSEYIKDCKTEKDYILNIRNTQYLASSNMMWGLTGLAISKTVLNTFEHLDDDCQTEDSTLRFRSILIGDVLTSAIYGLNYRIHDKNISQGAIIFNLKTIPIATQYEKDLFLMKNILKKYIYNILTKKIQFYIRNRNLSEKYAISSNKMHKLFIKIIQKLYVTSYKIYMRFLIYIPKIYKYLITSLKTIFIKLYNLLYFLIYKKNLIVINGSFLRIGKYISKINIGDDINYDIVKFLSNKRVINYSNIALKNYIKLQKYICIGSIINHFTDKYTVIWGSGAIYGGTYQLPNKPLKICAVRGKLTREYLLSQGIYCPEIYGDPALLLPYIYMPQNIEKKYKVGVIPHMVDFNLPNVQKLKEIYGDSILIIDLHKYKNWKNIIDQINQCEFVISSSLHGLIFADAYHIPNIWITLSNNLLGGKFKFLDYFSSVERTEIEPFDYTGNQEIKLAFLEQYVKNYKQIKFDIRPLIESCPFIDNNIKAYLQKKVVYK